MREKVLCLHGLEEIIKNEIKDKTNEKLQGKKNILLYIVKTTNYIVLVHVYL